MAKLRIDTDDYHVYQEKVTLPQIVNLITSSKKWIVISQDKIKENNFPLESMKSILYIYKTKQTKWNPQTKWNIQFNSLSLCTKMKVPYDDTNEQCLDEPIRYYKRLGLYGNTSNHNVKNQQNNENHVNKSYQRMKRYPSIQPSTSNVKQQNNGNPVNKCTAIRSFQKRRIIKPIRIIEPELIAGPPKERMCQKKSSKKKKKQKRSKKKAKDPLQLRNVKDLKPKSKAFIRKNDRLQTTVVNVLEVVCAKNDETIQKTFGQYTGLLQLYRMNKRLFLIFDSVKNAQMALNVKLSSNELILKVVDRFIGNMVHMKDEFTVCDYETMT
eukprot:27828_1